MTEEMEEEADTMDEDITVDVEMDSVEEETDIITEEDETRERERL